MVCYLPTLDQYNGHWVDLILSANNKAAEQQSEGRQFDRQGGTWNEQGLCNVMLISRLPGKGIWERLTISKFHERYADGGWEETRSRLNFVRNVPPHRRQSHVSYPSEDGKGRELTT